MRAPLVSLLLLASTAARADDVATLLARYRGEPDVREVEAAAVREAGLHPELADAWRKDARLAALAPKLSADYRYVDLTRVKTKTGGDAPASVEDDSGAEQRPGVRVTWDLSQLVFNPAELDVEREGASLARAREALSERVTHVYFERREKEVERDLAAPGDVAKRLELQLEIDERTALLDALTGGFFSHPRRNAP